MDAAALAQCAATLRALMADPGLLSSPVAREVRAAIVPLHSLITARAFGGRGAGGAMEDAAAREVRTAALREKHHARDADKRFLEGCGLRAGRLRALEALGACDGGGAPLPRVMDGAVESAPAGGGVCGGSGGGATLHTPRACFICKLRFRELHHFYDALCPECAELNFRKRHATADLRGRVALVTGGRVKIGFHVALKLLRCGARVIATSRFPRDAAARFAAAPDFSEWGGRLEVVGLDLRDLGGLEAFCASLLRDLPRLDILVNNACQTVRRPAAYYAPVLPGELAPRAAVPPALAGVLARDAAMEEARGAALGAAALSAGRALLPGSGGGSGGSALLCDAGAGGVAAPAPPAAARPLEELLAAAAPAARVGSAALSQLPVAPEDVGVDPSLLPDGLTDVNGQQLDLRAHNSWTTTAEGVGTPELAEVMAINAMAPFILCARLKPLLAAGRSAAAAAAGAATAGGESDGPPPRGLAQAREAGPIGAGAGRGGAHGATAPPRPPVSCAFVVNVSSMEGKFYRAKRPTHPHTNMAKAALNMLTRTSAGEYAAAGVFMNAVDTGWINEELPLQKAAAKAAASWFATPLDEVDAAARVLDPVLRALEGGGDAAQPVYGSFWKDYFPCEW